MSIEKSIALLLAILVSAAVGVLGWRALQARPVAAASGGRVMDNAQLQDIYQPV